MSSSLTPFSRPDSVQVFVRTRPTEKPASELVAKGDKTIGIHLGRQGKGVEGGVNNQTTEWLFKFDELLYNASQENVYDTAAKDIVESVLQGYNGTIMAYGQTGAGKTYTMTGDHLSYDNRGIIPRAIGHIFRAINDRPDLSFRVSVSYVEIYNEHLFDLLAVSPPAQSRNPAVAHSVDLPIQEDINNGSISIKGLNKKNITNEQECLDALFHGDSNRSIGEHALNEQSTRSHCIYTIYLETRSRIESSEKVLVSKLNLIDLAGSERVGKTNSTGIILHEAKFINKSLTFLEQVVIALSTKHRDHIPFRQSRLTQLLKDSLGGNTKTRVICNVQIDKPNLEETISTLKFGTRMRKVTNQIAINIALDPLLHVAKLQKEIRELKQELQMHDTLANRLGISYDNYMPEESAELRKRLERYVGGGPQADEIEIVNLRQVRESFRIFKQMILDSIAKVGTNAGSKSSTQLLPGRASPEPQAEEPYMVGELDEDASGGFGLGMVAPERKPASRPDSRDEPLKPKNIIRSRARAAGQNIAAAVANPLGGATHQRGASAGRRLPTANTASGSNTTLPRIKSGERRASFGNGASSPTSSQQSEEKVNHALRSPIRASPPPPSTSEAAAFEQYRSSGPGFDASELLNAARADAASQRKELRAISIRVNETKQRIDELAKLIQQKKQERLERTDPSQTDVKVLDEEEYNAIQESLSAKATYKALFAQRQEIESNVRDVDASVQQARLELFEQFAQWYHEQTGQEPSTDQGLSPSQLARIQAEKAARRAEARKAQQEADDALDPEARSFVQATRNLEKMKVRPLVNGGRRPYIGSAFK